MELRFTNLIRSWRPFITRNVRKPKLFILFNNILKTTKQWNAREGTANSSRDVYWAKVTQQLTLTCRYSQLVANSCCWLACSLLETPFITRDFFFRTIYSWWVAFVNRFVRDEMRSWTDLFVMRGFREPICSWWEAFVNRFVRDEMRSWTDLFVMRGFREPICSWW
jgi:hypothetical protein